ncbi:MAG TPA: twin-arginine translocation signal domain-containing protein, partial [Methylomirabilota bacterium]
MKAVTRRKFIATASAATAGVAVGPWVLRAQAQSEPIKIGVVLPYTGVYAELGISITQGMKLVF